MSQHHMSQRRISQLCLLRCLMLCFSLFAAHIATAESSIQAPGDGWPSYGGDAGGMRFSSSSQITRQNVAKLHAAWTFHTHALDRQRSGVNHASFEATPVLLGDTLFFTSPFDVVFALNARTGEQRWSFDPQLGDISDDGLTTSRGVAVWHASTPLSPGQCSRRVVFGTLDAHLIALDADTGQPCAGFGQNGRIDLTRNTDFQNSGSYSVTSPPTIVGNVVVIGSCIEDNLKVNVESGVVRGFDVVTGAQLWSWEPLPWAQRESPRTGAGNTWSMISADPALGLVYLPTSSASPDYFGGLRPGDNRDADSVVALDGQTGRRVWGFQTVHHNLWDYDVPSEPLLFNFRGSVPALAITTKTGQVFVLDRRTGQPLYPVTETPVPASDVPGEVSSPTQPISSLPSLTPPTLPDDNASAWHRSYANAAFCREQLSSLRYDGLYTPPSLRGSLLYPSNVGGVNWGGAALDPTTNVLYANVNRELFAMKLVRRDGPVAWWRFIEPDARDWPLWLCLAGAMLVFNVLWRVERSRKVQQAASSHTMRQRPWLPSIPACTAAVLIASMAAVVCLFPRKIELQHFGHELSPQRGTPYLIARDPIVDHDHHPCVAPPWGALTAIDLNTGKLAWQTPLGTGVQGQRTGSRTFGGPIVTAGGLVFTASTDDSRFRAFDAATGAELWSSPLPASGRATPMSYTLGGLQYIVIAAGGHSDSAQNRGDSLVAFALN
jgi:quinoprotein glucose dehydrogenase